MFHTLTIWRQRNDGKLITTSGHSHLPIDQMYNPDNTAEYKDLTLVRDNHRIAVRTYVSLPIGVIKAVANIYLTEIYEPVPNCSNRKGTDNAQPIR